MMMIMTMPVNMMMANNDDDDSDDDGDDGVAGKCDNG